LVTATRLDAIRDRAAVDLLRSRESLRQEFGDTVSSARRAIANAKQTSQALVLEVTGQGPQKTLGRGFAIVRDEQGKPITSAACAKPGVGMEIEFRDGRMAAQAR
jgi:exodeoxyribonuclease VII large subunit